MTGVGWSWLVAGALVAGAGLVGWRTYLARRSPVVWRVPSGSRVAHAFLRVAVRAGERHGVPVVPVRHCGEWPVGELRAVPFAGRCRLCESAVERLGGAP